MQPQPSEPSNSSSIAELRATSTCANVSVTNVPNCAETSTINGGEINNDNQKCNDCPNLSRSVPGEVYRRASGGTNEPTALQTHGQTQEEPCNFTTQASLQHSDLPEICVILPPPPIRNAEPRQQPNTFGNLGLRPRELAAKLFDFVGREHLYGFNATTPEAHMDHEKRAQKVPHE